MTPVEEELCQQRIELLFLDLSHHIIEDDQQVEVILAALLTAHLLDVLVDLSTSPLDQLLLLILLGGLFLRWCNHISHRFVARGKCILEVET